MILNQIKLKQFLIKTVKNTIEIAGVNFELILSLFILHFQQTCSLEFCFQEIS